MVMHLLHLSSAHFLKRYIQVAPVGSTCKYYIYVHIIYNCNCFTKYIVP